MNLLEAAVRQVARDLTRRGRTWALVGGFAVSTRAAPRFTQDVDIAVAVEDDTGAEDLVRDLVADGYRLFATIEHDNGRLATVRFNRRVDHVEVVVDLLFASSGIEPEIASAAETIEIVPGLPLPVATTGHLIALKVLARDDDSRPQDLGDLRALLAVATPDDLVAAGDAVRLITERGYNRGRDLMSSLSELTTTID